MPVTRADIDMLPEPCQGPGPWEGVATPNDLSPQALMDFANEHAEEYSTVGLYLVKALVTVIEEGRAMGADLVEKGDIWAAVNTRFPDLFKWLHEPTGGQAGWAYNTALEMTRGPA